VDEVTVVTDAEIVDAMRFLFERTKLVVEPAGAVGVAALLCGALPVRPGERTCVVLSGGNVDVNLVARIIEHGLTRAGRYLVLRTRLDDRPGQLGALLKPLTEMRVNVIDIEHHRAGWLLPVDQSDVLLHLETRDAAHAREIIARLRGEGYDVEPLTLLPPA
jgi:threonine dehydratase